MPVVVRLDFLSSGIGTLAAIFKQKKLEEMGEKTGAVLEIERNVDIHYKVIPLSFSFPLPYYFCH